MRFMALMQFLPVSLGKKEGWGRVWLVQLGRPILAV